MNLIPQHRQLADASDANEYGDAYSYHGSDIHVDSETDSLVVHVVAEDICE